MGGAVVMSKQAAMAGHMSFHLQRLIVRGPRERRCMGVASCAPGRSTSASHLRQQPQQPPPGSTARHLKQSPLLMLKAWLAQAGVVAQCSIALASRPASVTSTRPSQAAFDPGNLRCGRGKAQAGWGAEAGGRGGSER